MSEDTSLRDELRAKREQLTAERRNISASTSKSIDDEVRAIHKGLMAEREPELFELPGYGKKLQVKYRMISSDEQDEIGEKIAEQARAGQIDDPIFMGYIDNLVTACVGFYVESDGAIVPLEETKPEYEGGPIRWGDERLIKFFRFEDAGELRVRQIVRKVLTDDRLVLRHGQEVTRWIEQSLTEVKADF